MRIHKCYFCSSPIYPGHGIMFVRNDSKEFRFCRSKCHKAFKRRKNPRKTRWTKAYRMVNGKDLTRDPSMQFEVKRNSLDMKYSRKAMQETLEAMKRIHEIKTRRANAYIMNRLKVGTALRRARDKRLVETKMHLIRAPHAPKLEEEESVSEMEDEDEQMEVSFETEEQTLNQAISAAKDVMQPKASVAKKVAQKQKLLAKK